MTTTDATFVSIYERYYRQVYAYCRRRVSADVVDDVVADVFLVVWRRIAEVPPGEATAAWLYGVAYRVLGHQFRGWKRHHRLKRRLNAIGVEPVSAVDLHVVQNEELSRVLDALGRLRPSEQEILRLSLWEELSHASIASILDISVDACKQRLSRARKSLAREYLNLETKHSTPLLPRKEVHGDH